jgi:hypothetical protein
MTNGKAVPYPGVLTICALALLLAGCAKGPATYDSPDAAASALVDALKNNDKRALTRILGSDSDDLISSGDPVADNNEREFFLARYAESNALVESNKDTAFLRVGADAWTLPLPIVKRGKGWSFDAAAGAEEIVARRIGRNELSAILVSLAYVDAQYDYARSPVQQQATPEYAQQIVSSKGKHDGLYWPAEAGAPESPIGPGVANAQAEGYTAQAGKTPYHGYYYRILKAQGPSATGGAYDYIVNGRMIGGFALVAYPAEYGASGIKTFIVNHTGVVYEKDLGEDTEKQASRMDRYAPDPSWQPVTQDVIELTEAL